MSSPLPCFQDPPTCHLFDYRNKCRSHRDVATKARTVEWVLEHERCPELVARAEGWEVVR